MVLQNIKIIEDKSRGQLKAGSIIIHLECLFVGPTDIQVAEDWEDSLVAREIPYVLAEFETTVLTPQLGYENQLKSKKKGYGLFLNPNDLEDIRSNLSNSQ